MTEVASQILPDAPPHQARPVAWLPVLTCALLAVATFLSTLGGTYIYDDLFVVQSDPRISNPYRWREFLTGAYMPMGVDNLYRPLTSLSFAVEWWLHGDRPWAFHLVTILLHAATTGAVAAFVSRLWGTWPAWVAGLLFAVHPVHVEAVAGLVGRAESICTLATFCGLILCLRRPLTSRRVVGIFVCFVIALLAKEQGLLFPLLALLAIALPHALAAKNTTPPPAGKAERSARLWLAVLLIWSFTGYMLYRESILKFGWDRSRLDWWINPMIRSAGADRWLMPLVLVGRYVVLLLAPARLSIDYGTEVIGSTVRYHEPYVYIGGFAVVLWLAGLLVAMRRRSWPAVFCLLGLALTYGMISNAVIMIGTILGERLLYMPSAFFLAIVGGLAARLHTRASRRAGVVVLIVLTGLGFVRSITYAELWNDRVGFYEYTLARNPKSMRAYVLLHEERVAAKDWLGALRVAEACQQNLPEMWESDFLAAWAHMELGHFATAKALLLQVSRRGASNTTVGMWMEIEGREAATRPAGNAPPPEKPSS